ncbi:MAG: indole-3-glycerol phosphate synthase TrpC [Rhodospirillaceae bacterium]|nr:indole-3-glycerol phosphate synthase TrpC [Rhodospirillaceae bacterium]
MSDTLARICADKREHVARCRDEISLAEIEKRAASAPRIRGFADSLAAKVASGGTGLIGEIKKASPSKGLIRDDFAPAAIARAYAKGGATCLSVLTDIPYFQGQDDYLTAARMATGLPVLRKDFMLDPYQIFEARAIGADCILLIMAALEDRVAKELANLASDLGMDVLIEVHNAEELERASNINSRMLGINNRNLKTLEVDIAISEELAKLAPKDRILVAESGLNSRVDLDRMAAVGAHCVLVGESLMRQTDVAMATRVLLTGDAADAV